MIYYVCKYTPLELLAGFDSQCERLDPAPAGFDCADSCAHPNLCGFGKAVIEEVTRRNIVELLLTDCCDVMRRVYDVLKAGGKMKFLYLLPLPHKSGSAERRLFAAELLRLVNAWKQYSGQPFQIESALSAWEAGRTKAAQAAVSTSHVSLSGAHGGGLLLDTISPRFALPVTDDTCTGRRELPAPAGSCPDETAFFADYAAALLGQKNPCMRMLGSSERETNGDVTGIIYHTVKFCDYYGFEYHKLRQNRKIPLLKIETDCTPQSSGQLRTRIDAFAETLHAGVHKDTAPLSGNAACCVAGVDSGSASTDAVVMNREKRILGSAVLPTGAGAAAGAERALQQALQQAGLTKKDLSAVISTGYGRDTVGLTGRSVTEITCHARGAHFLYPQARTVIDIGGQDSKVIRIDENGGVVNFIMNDKCAAGTGRFLEMMARTLELTLDEMSALGLQWKKEVVISSMCTVFAESEVVSLVAQNVPAADIIHGLNQAVAGKTAALAKRLGGEPGYIMTGGVARNRGVVKALEEKLGLPVLVSDKAQLCGAIGAALIALDGENI